MERILVTGALGLVGSELLIELQKKFSKENVIALDIGPQRPSFEGISVIGNVRDRELLKRIVDRYQISQIYHLASLLSVGSEKNPDRAWNVNIGGLKNVLDLAREKNLRVFWPSSIAVFGKTTPKREVPQHSSFEPVTIYGVTKVTGEMLGQYYHHRFGVDFRSLRFPGLNGTKAKPGDGTTEYAIHIFYGLIRENRYTCFLKPDTRLPMMYMDDAVRGTMMLMDAPVENISVRTSYNFSAVSFTPAELVQEIRKISPDFEIIYQPDERQMIADSWPETIDDSVARQDWHWKESYDLEKMVVALYEGVKERIAHEQI